MDPSLLPNELLKTCEARLRSSIHALMLVLHNQRGLKVAEPILLPRQNSNQINLVSRLLFILFTMQLDLSIQIILEL